MSLFTTSHPHISTCACSAMFAIPTSLHKLPTNCPPPRSTHYVFLEYSADHKGYWCLNLSTNNIVISRHIVFDEAVFPFAASPHLTIDLDIFLQDDAPGAAPMPAPLPAPRVPLGFLPLAAASSQTTLLGHWCPQHYSCRPRAT
jgi:hypothetical protein